MQPREPVARVPLLEEELVLDKRQKETGRVRVHARVVESEALIEDSLLRESVEVERVPIGRVVESPPDPRREGETLIIPVLEEVLVIEKRLMLKEELRITRRSAREPYSRAEPVKRHVVEVTRLEADPDSPEPKVDPSS